MKFSVVTVNFNAANTLCDSIRSVSGQNNVDFEHIVIDGGSDDDSLEILNSNKHDRLKYVSEPDRGIYDAMNKGIAMSSGDIIAILNSDDFYSHSTVLAEVHKFFESDEQIDVVLGGVKFVNPKNLSKVVRVIRSIRFSPWMMRFGFMPPHPSVFIKKKCYNRLGVYNTNYNIAADFDLLVRFLYIHRVKFISVSNFWVYMRTGGVSTSGLKSFVMITREMLNSLNSHHIYSSFPILVMRAPIKFILSKLIF